MQSFSLAGDAGNPAYACKLQGGINEQFEGDFPPAGWTVKNNTSSAGNIWKRNDEWGRANLTGGTGYCAAADSDIAGSGAFDTELLSPLIVMPATPRNLVFKHRFQYIYTTDRGYVDVSTNGGATWTNLRTFSATDSTEQTIDMSAYAGMTIVLRWRYVSGSWAYYWQIDDVRTQTIPPPPPLPVLAESFTAPRSRRPGGLFTTSAAVATRGPATPRPTAPALPRRGISAFRPACRTVVGDACRHHPGGRRR